MLILFALIACSCALPAQDDLSELLSRFQTANDIPSKEAILATITTGHPEAGPALLRIAQESKNDDTKWLAIRGIGYLKFSAAAPFLKQSLTSKTIYVRANSARALGEIKDSSAASDLIRLLGTEQDSGVIEQTAMALQMLGAREALPALKSRAEYPTPQTRIWILGAIEALGSKAEVPFFASFLQDKSVSVAVAAAHSIERAIGEDFGFPKCEQSLCAADYDRGLQNAQRWWTLHKAEWKQLPPAR